eukprot:Nk52_evm99s352 gene=Nk52_evmTU99s352
MQLFKSNTSLLRFLQLLIAQLIILPSLVKADGDFYSFDAHPTYVKVLFILMIIVLGLLVVGGIVLAIVLVNRKRSNGSRGQEKYQRHVEAGLGDAKAKTKNVKRANDAASNIN